MSDSQTYEEVTVGSDGVTVTKRFEEEEFPVPAIAFNFQSSREEEVRVRLSDRVPDEVAVEDLGFHPEYGSEYWTIDDETIIFERELAPDSEYTTVYGIRATGADTVEQFLTDPIIEEVDPPLPESERESGMEGVGEEVIPDSDDVVSDVIAGEGDVPGLESERDESDQDEEEIEKLDLTDPTGDGQIETDTDDETVEVEGEGSVITTMADEIRANDVAIDDLKLLQRAFAEVADGTSGGATEARISKLQSDVADLRAYLDALEEFLDEEGSGEQLIDEFRRDLEEVRSQLEGIESDLESNEASIDEIEETVDTVRDEMDSVREDVTTVREEMDGVTEEVDQVRSDIETVRRDVDDVSADVDDVEGTVEDVSSDIDDVESTVEELSTDFEGFQSTVEEMDDTVDDLASSVEELEARVEDGEALDRIEDIENDLEDLQEWQEQIKKTFGGG